MNIHIGPNLPLGCGLHTDRVEHLYRTTSPLLVYLKSWGGEFVLVIRDGNILGMVRRDRRPAWEKLRERMGSCYRTWFPKKESAAPLPTDEPMAGCAA